MRYKYDKFKVNRKFSKSKIEYNQKSGSGWLRRPISGSAQKYWSGMSFSTDKGYYGTGRAVHRDGGDYPVANHYYFSPFDPGMGVKVLPDIITLGGSVEYHKADIYNVNMQESKGEFIETIEAEDGAYPDNGVKRDYWYVKTGLANRAPVISGKDEDLGDVTKEINYKYTVSDEDGDTMTVTETLIVNGGVSKVLSKYTEVQSGREFNIKIDLDTIYNLPLHKEHKVEIEVSDGEAVSKRVLTFKVTNRRPILKDVTENGKTLYTNSKLVLEGSALDEDSGDVLSAFYEIQGKRYALVSKVSDGVKEIPYREELMFKEKQLFKGDTPIASNLEDGKKHKIKIYALDDKGAKSNEREVFFYVVNNRPATVEISDISTLAAGTDFDDIIVKGKIEDKDGHDSILFYRVNTGEEVKVSQGKDREFEFKIPVNQFSTGSNSLFIIGRDIYGSETSNTVTITKLENSLEMLSTVRYYELLSPTDTIKGLLFWVARDTGDIDLKVEIAYGDSEFEEIESELVSNIDVNTVEEEYVHLLEEPLDCEKVFIRITQNRSDVSSSAGIRMISGVFM